MEKLKDFFYDKNDLVVALMIIAIAGALIFWRVNCIMDYPKVLAAQVEEQGSLSSNGTMDGDDSQAGDDGTADGDGSGGNSNGGTPAPGTTTGGGTTPSSGGVTSGGNPPSTPGTTTNNPPASGTTVSVTIPAGASSDKIAQILVDAGLVSSKSDFISAVNTAKADRKLKAGTFKIPAGSTTAEVVSIITK